MGAIREMMVKTRDEKILLADQADKVYAQLDSVEEILSTLLHSPLLAQGAVLGLRKIIVEISANAWSTVWDLNAKLAYLDSRKEE